MAPTRTSMGILAAAALVAGCGARPAPPAGGGVAVARPTDGGAPLTLTTADGIKLAAAVWPGGDGCVVLVHQLASTHEEWAPLVRRLRGRHEVLALDLRGHGGSTRAPAGPIGWRDLDEPGWRRAVLDLDAAAAWLRGRGLAPEDCVYVGASIGASLVVRFAAEAPPAGLVLISPGLTYRGLAIEDAAARYRGPALVIHGDEAGAAAAVAALEARWGDRLQRLHVAGEAHGVALIADEPALLDVIVGFVDDVLAGAGDDPPPAATGDGVSSAARPRGSTPGS